MKTSKRLFATIFLLCMAGTDLAQDVIVKKDQSTIMSKVLEITSTEVKYKKWSNQDEPTYTISISEVSNINYQNGDVERFSGIQSYPPNINTPQHQSQYRGHMDVGGFFGQLRINGRVLTDDEVRSLVTPQNFELYLKAKRQNTTGMVFDVIGIVSLGMASLFLDLGDNHEYLPTAGAFAIACAITLPTGLIIGASGGNKMKRIAQEYNQRQGKSYSLNLSPTLIKCDNAQSTNDCGLGLTISMNF